MSINEIWSIRTLAERINSMLYERTAISKKSEETVKNDLKLLKVENKMSTDLFFRYPYVLDFLGLQDTYSEKDLENAILVELEKFILEMVEGEADSIAIILCAEKNSEKVELLELYASGMHVAKYMTQLPPKEMLQGKLYAAIEKAKEKFEYKEIE